MTNLIDQITIHLRLPGQSDPDQQNLYLNGFRDYDPGLGRYIESDPIGIAGGINTYTYAANTPVNAIDPTGLIVYVIWHGAVFDGDPFNHAAIVLRPDNPSDFLGNGVLANSGGYEGTLGGQPYGPGVDSPFGALQYSYPPPAAGLGDLPEHMDTNPLGGNGGEPGGGFQMVPTPAGMTDSEFINSLINACNRFAAAQPLPYSPFPNAPISDPHVGGDPQGPFFPQDPAQNYGYPTQTYNSNSFTSGVITAAGATPPPVPNAPGYSKPVPIPR
jgi:RHS repeat-associated protein